MLFTTQSILLACTTLSSAAWAQPHGHIHGHQHGTSKRTTGVVSGRGIVYKDVNTGMGALAGNLEWSTDWSPYQDNPTNANLGTFTPQVWGLNNANGEQYLSKFMDAVSTFPAGSTILGFNEVDNIGQSWMTPQQAVDNWGSINDLKNSGHKICTPCPSNGNQTGTSGTGTITLQYQSDIDQGIHWLTEFLEAAVAAKPSFTFDCICYHWYGGPTNDLTADENLIDQQIGEVASLADQYGIEDIVIGEMGRYNPVQECEFVSWFQDEFLTEPKYAGSGNKVTAYSYNYDMFTLTSGDSLTPVGSAYIGEGSC